MPHLPLPPQNRNHWLAYCPPRPRTQFRWNLILLHSFALHITHTHTHLSMLCNNCEEYNSMMAYGFIETNTMHDRYPWAVHGKAEFTILCACIHRLGGNFWAKYHRLLGICKVVWITRKLHVFITSPIHHETSIIIRKKGRLGYSVFDKRGEGPKLRKCCR